MSIRLRLTLLYSAILALTLIAFGTALYTIQAQSTLDSLKRDLKLSGENMAVALLWRHTHPPPTRLEPERPAPSTFEDFSSASAFQGLREREIVRVLDAGGALVASPFGVEDDALPLTQEGLRELQIQNDWWEISSGPDGRLLIYSRPVVADDEVVSIVQVARPLAERDRTLSSLGITLIIASLLTILIAFGIGWAFSGLTLRPIHRITLTARQIGAESGTNEAALARRVDYSGPNDEIGQLATTFNSMLARLQEAYQRVSHALRMQRDFVADVSHELRTPLTTVRGNLALLRRDPPLPASEQADILSDAVEESDRLIRLVNDLLVLARTDAGQSLQAEPIRLQPVIAEISDQARQLDGEREIVENIHDLSVTGDRDALKQVLLIVMDNAIKYSSGAIQIEATTAGEKVEICVQDNGPGIPPDQLEHVFDRFYRGEMSASVPGFGLGLSIARSLIEGQGGTIAIESRLGHGSTVRVQLPRSAPESV